MSKPSQTEMEQEKEIGRSIVQQFIYRLPKKNHEAMIQLEKQLIDIFRKHGGLRYEAFQLSSTENMMDWTNIAKTMSANQDEEIWVEQVYYRNSKQRDEYMAMCGKDEKIWSDFTNSLRNLSHQDPPSWVSSTASRSR
jgi:uncharacterized protein YbaA (DUF1428 family)